MRKTQIITVREGGKATEIILPEGTRIVDVNELSKEDSDVLLILYIYGRKTRHYFKARGLLDNVHRLKSRGFIEAVRRGSNYSYDLSPFAFTCIKNRLV